MSIQFTCTCRSNLALNYLIFFFSSQELLFGRKGLSFPVPIISRWQKRIRAYDACCARKWAVMVLLIRPLYDYQFIANVCERSVKMIAYLNHHQILVSCPSRESYCSFGPRNTIIRWYYPLHLRDIRLCNSGGSHSSGIVKRGIGQMPFANRYARRLLTCKLRQTQNSGKMFLFLCWNENYNIYKRSGKMFFITEAWYSLLIAWIVNCSSQVSVFVSCVFYDWWFHQKYGKSS